MEKFTVLEGVAAPLKMINVDTDMIIPKQYLKTIKRTGLGKGLFAERLRRAARLCGLHPRVRAIDLVEIDPTRDVADATSLAAAACLLSFTSGLHQRLRG